MNPEPSPAEDGGTRSPGEFLIVLAIGDLDMYRDLFSVALADLLNDKPHRIEIVENTLIPELARMPVVRAASVVLVLTGAWGTQSNEPRDAKAPPGVITIRNVHRLRAATTATLIWATSYPKQHDARDVRDAGADLVLAIPFRFAELSDTILAAFVAWQASADRIPSLPPPPPAPFRVLVACGKERVMADAFADIVRFAIPDVPFEFSYPDTYDVHEISTMPEARGADLLIIFLSNLVAPIPDNDPDIWSCGWHERRVWILRNTCRGSILVLSSRLKNTSIDTLLNAGASAVLPAPCRAREMEPVIQSAYQRWHATRGGQI